MDAPRPLRNPASETRLPLDHEGILWTPRGQFYLDTLGLGLYLVADYSSLVMLVGANFCPGMRKIVCLQTKFISGSTVLTAGPAPLLVGPIARLRHHGGLPPARLYCAQVPNRYITLFHAEKIKKLLESKLVSCYIRWITL